MKCFFASNSFFSLSMWFLSLNTRSLPNLSSFSSVWIHMYFHFVSIQIFILSVFKPSFCLYWFISAFRQAVKAKKMLQHQNAAMSTQMPIDILLNKIFWWLPLFFFSSSAKKWLPHQKTAWKKVCSLLCCILWVIKDPSHLSQAGIKYCAQ